MKLDNGEEVMIINLYADDVLLAENNKGAFEWMKAELCERFELKDHGEAIHCLSLEIFRVLPEENLRIIQDKNAKDALIRLQMLDSRPVNRPLEDRRDFEGEITENNKSSSEAAQLLPGRHQ